MKQASKAQRKPFESLIALLTYCEKFGRWMLLP